MNQGKQIVAVLVLTGMIVACSNPPLPPQEPEIEQSAPPTTTPPSGTTPPDPESAPIAPLGTSSGSMVVYGCDDGSSVTVTYDEYSALVKLPSGSTTLSHADAISGSGEEAYLGEELSLYRNGDAIRLENAGKFRLCSRKS